MGYQESFVYSKSGNNENINKAVEILRKYKYQQFDVVSIGTASVLKDFSNNHKKKFPIINWCKGTSLLFVAGERYYQYSINRLFSIDIYTRYNINRECDDNEILINYTDDEYEILDDLEILFIDDYIDPKLKGPFDTYFGNVNMIINPDKDVTKVIIRRYTDITFYTLYGESGYIEDNSINGNTKTEDVLLDINSKGYTILDTCEILE